jgi:glyoxylase-like metal-dependent hydrolase (beta-lactamase superfamily II)
MRYIADGVWQLLGHPHYYINAYLVNDVLVDAATRFATGRLLRQLAGRRVRMVALTHCHPDHQGAARAVCERFAAPLACHALDVPTMEGHRPMLPRNWVMRLASLVSGPPRRVDHVLQNGSDVAGFRVVHAPGHTPGHILLFRPTDRLVIAGDLLANLNFLTGKPGLREPPFFFSVDPVQNRRSLATLLELKPNLVCFGHGPPLRDMERLRTYIERRLRRL